MQNPYNRYPCYDYMRAAWYNYMANQAAAQYYPYDRNISYASMQNRWYYPGRNGFIELKDYGPNPFVVNIEDATKQNNNFRTSLWTGDNLQLTLMSIEPGGEIGLEMHPDVDQFVRIEDGRGVVLMGDKKDDLDFEENVKEDYIFIIPAGKWHNLINTGNKPIKLYSIYAPPEHPHGTVHKTKEDEMH